MSHQKIHYEQAFKPNAASLDGTQKEEIREGQKHYQRRIVLQTTEIIESMMIYF